MDTGILYFSSTGNSVYLAKKLQSKLGGEVRYIPRYDGDGSEFKRIIIVTPVYSFGLPLHVAELLPRLNKSSEIIAVLNYGGMVGGADKLFYEYAKRENLNAVSVYTVKMPENFTLVMSPPAFITNSVLHKSDCRISRIAENIRQKKYRIATKRITHEKTYLKNRSNWHLIGKRFTVNDNCVRCGKCVNICPINNITMLDGKITFADKCVACLGCFHRCPQNAIIYMNKNKKRYLNPLIDENDIGKDF